MSIRQSYLMDEVKKLCELIVKLRAMTNEHNDRELLINQSLSDLTALDNFLFAGKPNATFLNSILSMLPDDNQKALVAHLLLLKDSNLYADLAKSLLASVNKEGLHADIKSLIAT